MHSLSVSGYILLLVYYPHMPIGKVWIYRLLFVCIVYSTYIFVCTARIKLAVSNFAR